MRKIRRPVLLIHGGASLRKFKGQEFRDLQMSLEHCLSVVYPKLLKGMSALEAASRACALLEDDPLYNAGFGSKLQSDGKIRMSAAIMDGSKRRLGGCVNVEGVKNPILLAKALMKEKDRVLSGEGAKRFARSRGLAFSSPYTPKQRALWRSKKIGKSGTVGAVVLDQQGRLAAATSTGGRGFEYPFRVSDSPTVAGNFASEICAVSATGTGEQIVEHAVAAAICSYMDAGLNLKTAVKKMLIQARKKKAEFGFIATDRKGEFVIATTTKDIIWAAADWRGFHLMK